jgi:hypothetical protein
VTEPEGQRRRIASLGSVAWVTGALGSFASMSAFAAKFQWFNNASLGEFKELLMSVVLEPEVAQRHELAGAIDGDIADLSIWHLARALGEPGDTLRTMSRRDFLPESIPPSRGSDFRLAPRYEPGVRVCRVCIKEGFHSFFHEFEWLEYCVFHRDEPLVRAFSEHEARRSRADRQEGLGPFGAHSASKLLDLWLGEDDDYAIGSAGMYSAVPDRQTPLLVSALRQRFGLLAAANQRAQGRAQLVWGGGPAAQAFNCFSGLGGGSAWKAAFDSSMTSAKPMRYAIAMTRPQAIEILNCDWSYEKTDHRMIARLISCQARDIPATWRSPMRTLFKRLRSGHETCIYQLSTLLSTCDPAVKRRWGCSPACSLSAKGLCLCLRLRILDVISHACEPYAYTADIQSNSTWPYPGIGRCCTEADTCRVLPRLPMPTHRLVPKYNVVWDFKGSEDNVTNFLVKKLHVAQPPGHFSQFLDVLLEVWLFQLEASVANLEAQWQERPFGQASTWEQWRDFESQMRRVQPMIRVSHDDNGLLVQAWASPQASSIDAVACTHTSRRLDEIQRSIERLSKDWSAGDPQHERGFGSAGHLLF